MPCPKGSMKWKKAMGIARRQYPSYGLTRRRRIAAGLVRTAKKYTRGTKKYVKRIKKRAGRS